MYYSLVLFFLFVIYAGLNFVSVTYGPDVGCWVRFLRVSYVLLSFLMLSSYPSMLLFRSWDVGLWVSLSSICWGCLLCRFVCCKVGLGCFIGCVLGWFVRGCVRLFVVVFTCWDCFWFSYMFASEISPCGMLFNWRLSGACFISFCIIMLCFYSICCFLNEILCLLTPHFD